MKRHSKPGIIKLPKTQGALIEATSLMVTLFELEWAIKGNQPTFRDQKQLRITLGDMVLTFLKHNGYI